MSAVRVLPTCLRILQNNKALKPTPSSVGLPISLRILQNNKALKLCCVFVIVSVRLRILQNNKALKPQIRAKAHAAARLFCKYRTTLPIY